MHEPANLVACDFLYDPSILSLAMSCVNLTSSSTKGGVRILTGLGDVVGNDGIICCRSIASVLLSGGVDVEIGSLLGSKKIPSQGLGRDYQGAEARYGHSPVMSTGLL